MAESHMSNSEFLDQLATLFTQSQQHETASVHLTQKRLSYDHTSPTKTAPKPRRDSLTDLTPPEQPLPVLIRATNGKNKAARKEKVKLSTVVQPDELDAFFAKYAETCRAGMVALKKRDRKARKKKAKKGAEGEKKG